MDGHFRLRLSTRSAANPTAMPAIIDSTGKPGICGLVDVGVEVVICVGEVVVICVGTVAGTKSIPFGLANVLPKGAIFPEVRSRVPIMGLPLSFGSPTNTVPVGNPVISRA